MRHYSEILESLEILFQKDIYKKLCIKYGHHICQLKLKCHMIISLIKKYEESIIKLITNFINNSNNYTRNNLTILKRICYNKIFENSIYNISKINNLNELIDLQLHLDNFNYAEICEKFNFSFRNINNYDYDKDFISLNSINSMFLNIIELTKSLFRPQIFLDINKFSKEENLFLGEITNFLNSTYIINKDLFNNTFKKVMNNIYKQFISNSENINHKGYIISCFYESVNLLNRNLYSVENVKSKLIEKSKEYGFLIQNAIKNTYINNLKNNKFYKDLVLKYNKILEKPTKIIKRISFIKLHYPEILHELQLSYLHIKNNGEKSFIPINILKSSNPTKYLPLTINNILDNSAHNSVGIIKNKEINGCLYLGNIIDINNENGELISSYVNGKYFLNSSNKYLYSNYGSIVLNYNNLKLKNYFWKLKNNFEILNEFIMALFLSVNRGNKIKKIPFIANEILYLILENISIKDMLKDYKYKRNKLIKI